MFNKVSKPVPVFIVFYSPLQLFGLSHCSDLKLNNYLYITLPSPLFEWLMPPDTIIALVTLLVSCPPTFLVLWRCLKGRNMSVDCFSFASPTSTYHYQRPLFPELLDNLQEPLRGFGRHSTFQASHYLDIELGIGATVTVVREYGTS